ncbi:hypothetical protein PF616_06380, partial [Streptococcus thermophilus]|uniref:hypothetical protein n=1 Tax=Streptococcus thermophilus TaxID=1308 RepID=UPI0022EAB94E
WLLSLTVSSLLSNEITGLLKDSKTNIFKQGEVANFIIELSTSQKIGQIFEIFFINFLSVFIYCTINKN